MFREECAPPSCRPACATGIRRVENWRFAGRSRGGTDKSGKERQGCINWRPESPLGAVFAVPHTYSVRLMALFLQGGTRRADAKWLCNGTRDCAVSEGYGPKTSKISDETPETGAGDVSRTRLEQGVSRYSVTVLRMEYSYSSAGWNKSIGGC